MRKIILLIDCASEYDRRLLRGLVKYSKEHGSWLFYRMPSHLRENLDSGRAVIDWARKWKADAIVGRWRWEDPEMLSSLNIPVVLQNYSSRSRNGQRKGCKVTVKRLQDREAVSILLW